MAGQKNGQEVRHGRQELSGRREDEIEIGGRRYVNKPRLASIIGISVRTLTRWDEAGIGPPKIKLGKSVFFDLGKIPEWLASREIPSTGTQKGNHRGQYRQ